MLSELPSELILRHLPDDARLRIRYRTMPDVSATLSSNTGFQADVNVGQIDLPSAPEGNEVIVELDALGLTARKMVVPWSCQPLLLTASGSRDWS